MHPSLRISDNTHRPDRRVQALQPPYFPAAPIPSCPGTGLQCRCRRNKTSGSSPSRRGLRSSSAGIAAIDSTVEFKEIVQRTPNVPVNQITFLRDNVYRYYGVNEKVLTSTLSDQEWISFYENVIEPIWRKQCCLYPVSGTVTLEKPDPERWWGAPNQYHVCPTGYGLWYNKQNKL